MSIAQHSREDEEYEGMELAPIDNQLPMFPASSDDCTYPATPCHCNLGQVEW